MYSNGYITVDKTYDSPNPPQGGVLPKGFPLFAPYWTDIDASGEGGSVFVDTYDLTSDNGDIYDEVVTKVKMHIDLYGGIADFEPTYTVVATWEQVAPYPANKTAGIEVDIT